MSELIQQKMRQYLLHSFLYYQLDESIIADRYYDQICAEVLQLMETHKGSSHLPYQELVKKSLSEDTSGFSVRKYPAEIISSALHLLYQHNAFKSMSFETFLTRFGYSLS
jgi:NAD-dependent DNA ligase